MGMDPEGIHGSCHAQSPLPSPRPDTSLWLLQHLQPSRTCQVSPTAPQGPGEHARPVLPTSPTLCKPQIRGRGHVRIAGTNSLGVMKLCPSHHPWGFGNSERTHGQLSSTQIGVTHIWGCSDIPRLNFAAKISFIKYFSFSFNILHFISRISREGTAVLCGHRDSHPDPVPGLYLGENIVPWNIPPWGQALLWDRRLWRLQGLAPPGSPCCMPGSWNGLV